MANTHRTHFDNLALEKFNAGIGVEYSHFCHAVIFVDGKESLWKFCSHARCVLAIITSGCRRSNRDAAASA
jgi:hypothetical protein